MTELSLFYYPYASFTNAQLALLKVAALYFDRLVILDPVGASWTSIGADQHTRKAVKQLRDARILQTVSPADVLAKYAGPITDAIRQDMQDEEFQVLCEARGGGRWTLSLAKVPQDLQTDQTMRHLMGDFAREVAMDSGQYRERAGGDPSEYYEYAETGQTYDEYREGYGGDVEYRYADFPLSEEFAAELEHKTIPDIAKELDEAREARDAWLNSKRGRLALSATGIAVGTAAAVLSIFAAPLTPVALATAGLGLASGTAIPGVEWLLDWRDGKNSAQENGLHYLLRT